MRSHDSENHSNGLVARLGFENFRQGQQIFGVVDGILDHLIRERTQCPVGFLGSLPSLTPKCLATSAASNSW